MPDRLRHHNIDYTESPLTWLVRVEVLSRTALTPGGLRGGNEEIISPYAFIACDGLYVKGKLVHRKGSEGPQQGKERSWQTSEQERAPPMSKKVARMTVDIINYGSVSGGESVKIEIQVIAVKRVNGLK